MEPHFRTIAEALHEAPNALCLACKAASDADGLTDVQRYDLDRAAYWAAQAIWWARSGCDQPQVGRCLERLEGWARKLPNEYARRGVQLADAIERAALLPR
jgi:hypothetical protein